MKTQQEDGHLQAKGSGLKGTMPTNTLISDPQPPELWGNKFAVCEWPRLWCFVTASLAHKDNALYVVERRSWDSKSHPCSSFHYLWLPLYAQGLYYETSSCLPQQASQNTTLKPHRSFHPQSQNTYFSEDSWLHTTNSQHLIKLRVELLLSTFLASPMEPGIG